MEEPTSKKMIANYRDVRNSVSDPFELKCPNCSKPLKKSMNSTSNYWKDDPTIVGAENIYGHAPQPGDRMVTNYKRYVCSTCGDWVLVYTFNQSAQGREL